VALAIVSGWALAALAQADTEPSWIRDFTAGQQAAQAAGKDLLILFTGHGWCQPCEIFDDEVIQDKDFLRAASEKFVLLELDENFGDTPAEKQREADHEALKTRFLSPAVPTIILSASDCVPYAVLGYSLGDGPDKTLERLVAAQAAGRERDKHLAAARRAAPADRAALLNAAIVSVAPLLGPIEERGDDPVLVFYRPQIDEILKLAPPDAEFAQAYRDRLAERDAWLASRAILKKVSDLQQANADRELVDLITHEIGQIADANVRMQLETSRFSALVRLGEFDAAREIVRGLGDQAEDPRVQSHWYDCEAEALVAMDRIDDAAARYDQRIAAAATPRHRVSLLSDKASMLGRHDRLSESLEVWQVCRDAAEPESLDWLSTTAWYARARQQAGHHAEAVALFDAIFLTYQRAREGKVKLPWPFEPNGGQFIMLEAAQSWLELGDLQRAYALVDEAESAIPRLESSTRADEREQAARIKTNVSSMREKLSAARASSRQ
jgi:hypothetical protein